MVYIRALHLSGTMNDKDPFPSSLPGGHSKTDQFAEPNPYLLQAIADQQEQDAKLSASESKSPLLFSATIATITGVLLLGFSILLYASWPDSSSTDRATTEQVEPSDAQVSKAKERLKELLAKAKEKKSQANVSNETITSSD